MERSPRKIELLAPARNIQCGKEAILHGADAVYIGASKFGARAAAGNSVEEIGELCRFAHFYGAKIYVTVNTILKDEELEDTLRMIQQLDEAEVDALIVQDMALLQMADRIPHGLELHASTQMDNRTPAQVEFLRKCGMDQVVLARELSLDEISRIHQACDVRLEAFVHGALCVSFSGRCYASQVCFGRSANRGECAQFCRLSFDMEDAEGKKIIRKKHLLSLKDMNRSQSLEEMMDAGISSFKIEGRLKDADYVKNITAYYREKMDEIFSRRKEYTRASSGRSTFRFTPDPEKTFNRGFTSFFLHGREKDITSFDTPKSRGEKMGEVLRSDGHFLTVKTNRPFHNGDGICYIDKDGLRGLRVNRVEGDKLFPSSPLRLPPHTVIYRNFDNEFEKTLKRPTAERKIQADLLFKETEEGYSLILKDTDGYQGTADLTLSKEEARTPQKENIQRQLTKWGNTPFEPRNMEIQLTGNPFIPASSLSEIRRTALERLKEAREKGYTRHMPLRFSLPGKDIPSFYTSEVGFEYNVMNKEAARFYHTHGVSQVTPALEKQEPAGEIPVMFCKHCLRFSMGWCPTRQHGHSPYKEPYYLRMDDGRRFRLKFDCAHCQMIVLAKGAGA